MVSNQLKLICLFHRQISPKFNPSIFPTISLSPDSLFNSRYKFLIISTVLRYQFLFTMMNLFFWYSIRTAYSASPLRKQLMAWMEYSIQMIQSFLKCTKLALFVVLISNLYRSIFPQTSWQKCWKIHLISPVSRSHLRCARMMKQQTLEFLYCEQCERMCSFLGEESLRKSKFFRIPIYFLWQLLVDRLYLPFFRLIAYIFYLKRSSCTICFMRRAGEGKRRGPEGGGFWFWEQNC